MKFQPHWWCRNGSMQTIASMYFPRILEPLTSHDHIIKLSDGESTLVHESNPHHSKNLFILVHGLTGSAESRCVNRLAQHFYAFGHGVVRVNLRGCGAGRHLSKEICHAGRSEDLSDIINYFHTLYPKSSLHCIGFSLGGNLLLKMACKKRGLPLNQLSSVVAISPPIDLKNCVHYLSGRSQRWLDYYFVKTLIKLSKEHPTPYNIPNQKIRTLYDFDNLITAHVAGFRNADEYYEYSSSIHDLNKLSCPVLIISARDDPCVNFEIFARVKNLPMVSFIGTDNGGHGAYLGHTETTKELWLEKIIHLWLEKKVNLESAKITDIPKR